MQDHRKLSQSLASMASYYLRFIYWSITSADGRYGGLMVSALDSGSSGPGSSPGRGHYVVFLDNTLCFHSASFNSGGNPAMVLHHIQGWGE